MKNTRNVYLDHQATTPMAAGVLEAMRPYFAEKFGNPHATDHAHGWRSLQVVSDSTAKVARLIGADPDEIVFVSGATEANNLALLGLAARRVDVRRNRILVSAIEHKSVLAVASVLAHRFGYRVESLPVDSEGCVSRRSLECVLDDSVFVVSIMAVNNEIGTIQDIRSLSTAAHDVGAIVHSDAAQAPVAMHMDTLVQDVDLISLSAHKMGGPPGIGALYVRREIQQQIEPIIHGGGQQNGLRSGTIPVPLCVGMGAAAEVLQCDLAKSRSDLQSRRDKLVEKLRSLPWTITINGPPSHRRHPGNANVCFHGFSANEILNAVQPELAASTGSACTSGMPAPSHVLRAIGLSGDDAEASIRFSLGFATRDEDVESAVDIVAKALVRLSQSSVVRQAI